MNAVGNLLLHLRGREEFISPRSAASPTTARTVRVDGARGRFRRPSCCRGCPRWWKRAKAVLAAASAEELCRCGRCG